MALKQKAEKLKKRKTAISELNMLTDKYGLRLSPPVINEVVNAAVGAKHVKSGVMWNLRKVLAKHSPEKALEFDLTVYKAKGGKVPAGLEQKALATAKKYGEYRGYIEGRKVFQEKGYAVGPKVKKKVTTAHKERPAYTGVIGEVKITGKVPKKYKEKKAPESMSAGKTKKEMLKELRKVNDEIFKKACDIRDGEAHVDVALNWLNKAKTATSKEERAEAEEALKKLEISTTGIEKEFEFYKSWKKDLESKKGEVTELMVSRGGLIKGLGLESWFNVKMVLGYPNQSTRQAGKLANGTSKDYVEIVNNAVYIKKKIKKETG